MSLTRTTVYVEASDLATINSAAEIIRHSVHRTALSLRQWDEPMNLPQFSSGDPTLVDKIDEIIKQDFDGDLP